MKHFSSILLIFLTSFLYAQNPTYEQTVDYLNQNVKGRMMYKGALDSYARATGYKLTNIVIEKNGRIEFKTNQKNGINDFSIVFNIFDLTSSIDYPDGIRANNFSVQFKGLNVTEGYGITFATKNDAIKVARAFRHLKTLCNQDDDLFSAPPKEEKKATLTIDETIQYITKLLSEQGDVKIEMYSNEGFYKTTTISDQQFSKTSLSCSEMKHEKEGTIDLGIENKEYSFNLIQNPISELFIRTVRSDPSRNIISYALSVSSEDYYDFHYKSKRVYGASSKSEASSGLYKRQWKTSTLRKVSQFTIYTKTISDAERLKKAFEHLRALIKESNTNQQTADPFGN
mgnify:CR=1 FL=1|tara:strand:- start:99 stop:1124 length:1026 start_codon:yes stop_codon:yes gene_type:complete